MNFKEMSTEELTAYLKEQMSYLAEHHPAAHLEIQRWMLERPPGQIDEDNPPPWEEVKEMLDWAAKKLGWQWFVHPGPANTWDVDFAHYEARREDKSAAGLRALAKAVDGCWRILINQRARLAEVQDDIQNREHRVQVLRTALRRLVGEDNAGK